MAALAFVCWGALDARADVFQVRDASGRLVLMNTPRRQTAGRSFDARAWLMSPYQDHIRTAASRYNLAPELIHAVIHVESNHDPRAVSKSGAEGLMQLMPETAASLGVSDAFDPSQNIDGGSRYLRSLMDLFKGDLELTLAAYNAGPSTVLKVGGVPGNPETLRYLEKLRKVLGPRLGPSQTTFATRRDGQGRLLVTNTGPSEELSRAEPLRGYRDSRGVFVLSNVPKAP